MKKFLAVLLATLMVLSCATTMFVGVSAEEEETSVTHQIELPLEGWSGGEAGQIGTGAAAIDVHKMAWSGALIGKQASYTLAEGIDLTGMKYIQFDMYVSDIDTVVGKTLCVEVSSDNTPADVYEIQFCEKYPLAEKWNTILIPLSAMADQSTDKKFDITDFKRVRIFFQEPSAQIEADDFFLAFKDLSFHDGYGNGGKELLTHSVVLDSCGASAPGWNLGADNTLVSPLTEVANNGGSIFKTIPAGSSLSGEGCILWQYDQDSLADSDAAAITYDISDVETMTFDFYITDASVFVNANWMTELTSSGNSDKDESNRITNLNSDVEGGLQNGWNKVVIPMSSFGNGADMTRINYFRMYANASTFSIGAQDLTFAIDNVQFLMADGSVKFSWDCDAEMNGWAGDTGAMSISRVTGVDATTGKDTVSFYSTMGQTIKAGQSGKLNMVYNNPDGNGVNITGMKYAQMEIYISDAAALEAAKNLTFTFSSSGSADSQNKTYTWYANNNKALGLSVGWNNVIFPLEGLAWVYSTDGNIINTFVNYMSVTSGSITAGASDFVFAIDNVRFWDGEPSLSASSGGEILQAKEIHALKAMSEAAEYQYNKDSWSLESSDTRYRAKNDGYFAFQFPIENAETTRAVYVTLELNGQAVVEVSVDGVTWEEVYRFGSTNAEAGKADNLDNGLYIWDVSEFVIDSESKALLGDTVYVRIGDAYPSTGWGGTVNKDGLIQVTAVYDIPDFEKSDNYSFKVNTAEEKQYLVGDNVGLVHSNGSHRYADKEDVIIWKYDLKRTTCLSGATWNASLKNEYKIWASIDGENWVEIAESQERAEQAYRNFALDGLDLSGEVTSIWIKLGDAKPEDGYGGAVFNDIATVLQVNYYDGLRLKTQTQEFTVLSDEEKAFIHESSKTNTNGDSHFNDANSFLIYQYDITSENPINQISWTAPISAEYVVCFSTDLTNWVEVARADGVANREVRTFYVPTYMVSKVEDAGKLYVRISDADTSNGNGGRVWYTDPVVLSVGSVELTDKEKDELEMTPTEHSVPLYGCNAAFGAFSVDIENKTAGSASVSLVWKEGQISAVNFETEIDASGMDTLEFDLYLSDLAMLDDIVFGGGDQIELRSVANDDNNEHNYSWSTVWADLKASGSAVAGWNHISIPFDKMTVSGNGCDLSALFGMRVFWVSAEIKSDAEYIMKLDNFRMTDAQARQDAADAEEKANFLAENAALVELLNALDEYKSESKITAENVEAAKAAIAAARAEYDKLTDEVKAIAEKYKYADKLTKAESAVQGYEDDLAEDVAILEQHQDLVDQINGLTTEITDDNYETVKAAAEAARAGYEALGSVKERNAFKDAGLLDKLQAAEEAVAAFTPGNGGNGGNGGSGGNGGNGGTGNEEEGCKSALTIGATAMMILAGAWVAMAARKKED